MDIKNTRPAETGVSLELLQRRREWLDNVQAIIRKALPANMADDLLVTNLDDDTLICSISSTALATMWRFGKIGEKIHTHLGEVIPGYKRRVKEISLRLRNEGALTESRNFNPATAREPTALPPPSPERIQRGEQGIAALRATLRATTGAD